MPDTTFARRLTVLAALLMILSLFPNLGVQPVYLEEPRRGLIAMEMEEAGNYIVPLQLGDYYYRKPPVFNWLIILSAQVFGDYSRWVLRLPTVLSVIATMWLLWAVGRRHMDETFGRLWALLYLGCGAIYFYFSMLGEIDLFYSLITLGSFLSFFHYYQRGQYALMFAISYALAAAGLLTKGLPSIPFLGITVLGWLLYERRWRLLFSWQHLVGILAFLFLAGGYLYWYHQYNSLELYIAELFAQSVDRTAAGNSLLRTLGHLLTFPLDTLKDMLPVSLLLIFALRRGMWQRIRQQPLLMFSLIVFFSNFALYWLSPGAKQRYIYMLYPLLLSAGLYAWQQRPGWADWRERSFRVLIGVLLAGLALGCLSLPFLPAFDFLPGRWWISLPGAVAFAGLFYAFRRKPQYSLHWLLLGLVAARLVFAFTVLPQRAHDSAGQRNTALARDIHEQAGAAPLYLLRGSRINYTVVYELDRMRQRTVSFTDELSPGAFVIVPQDSFPQYEGLLEIPFHERTYELIKVK